jgi:ABC-type transport system substrate-binding protein
MTEYNLKPVGTGPYKYKKLVKDKTGKIIAYYLEKNPKYFKHVPYINEVIFNFYDDADAAFKALIRGNIDLIKEISYYQKELIKKRKSIILSKVSLPRYYSIFFNQKNDL